MKATAITAIFFSFLIAGCGGQKSAQRRHSGIEYFRNIQWSETPYDIEKGVHSITPAEAETINSYKFTYNDQGKLESVEFVRNDLLLNYSSLEAAKIVYKYDGKIQTKFFFNKDNQPVQHDGIFAVQYALDAKENRVQLMYLAENGSMINNAKGIHYYNWSILPDGSVKEDRFSLDGQEIASDNYCSFRELRFTYNKEGYLTRMAQYRNDSLINCKGKSNVAYLAYTPDEDGDILTIEAFEADSQPADLAAGWSKRVNKYDENGYLTETVYYKSNNMEAPVFRYSYDAHGALTDIKCLNTDGQLVNDSTGAAVIQYRYDEAGQLTDTLFYDKDSLEIKIGSKHEK